MTKACRDIIPPTVAYALLRGQFGVFEIGSRTVLVELRIFGQEVSQAILFHEMVHYLQDKRSPLRKGILSVGESCADEKEAHDLTLKFSETDGVAKGDERINSWDQIKHKYPGCVPLAK
jgi:hypothetical protein